jgi:hypothetical protein
VRESVDGGARRACTQRSARQPAPINDAAPVRVPPATRWSGPLVALPEARTGVDSREPGAGAINTITYEDLGGRTKIVARSRFRSVESSTALWPPG